MNQVDLGEKGESRFRELCADAGLVCNKSDRDRTGWDFLVEFNHPDGQLISLDKRPVPLSCHVQVKTILARTSSIKLRLSSAERLAKEAKPAFIVVLKVDDERRFTECFLIHLLNDRLATILKRLREESVSSSSPITQRWIHFTPTSGEAIAANGASVRQALERACGPDLQEYIAHKRTQLRTLGYSQLTHTGRLSFHASDPREIGDIFLGLKQNVPLKHLELHEHRFGIKIEGPRLTDVTVTIHPTPEKCKVRFYMPGSSMPAAAFDANYFAVVIPSERVYITSSLFTIDISTLEQGMQADVSLEAKEGVTPALWEHYWNAVKVLRKGGGRLEIEFVHRQTRASLPLTLASKNFSRHNVKRSIRLSHAIKSLFERAEAPTDLTCDWDAIDSLGADILLVESIMTGKLRNFQFPMNFDRERLQDGPQPIVVANGFDFGAFILSYSAFGRLRYIVEGGIEYAKISDFDLRSLRILHGGKQEYSRFVEQAAQCPSALAVYAISAT